MQSLCILRLSALGDVTHVLPLIHALRRRHPKLAVTWVIGRFEHKLVGALPGVEFIPYDKKGGLKAYLALRRQLATRQFDCLFLMQLSARANLVSTAIRARRRIGFDARRSKEGHALFINERIAPPAGTHVLDALLQFGSKLDIHTGDLSWTLPSAPPDLEWARAAMPGDAPFAVISPASSHPLRNWTAAGYAALADHLHAHHGLRIALCGGPSALERELGARITAQMRSPVTNLIGQDSLPQFVALLRRARILVSPDSGPAHIAAIAATPVLGLYAATDPQRSGPYNFRQYCVNAYPEAAKKFLGKPSAELKWGQKIEQAGVMELIPVNAAIAHADKLLAATA